MQPTRSFCWTIEGISCCVCWAWLVLTLPTFSDAGYDSILGSLLIRLGMAIGLFQLGIAVWALLRERSQVRWYVPAGLVAAVLIQVSWATDLDFECRLWLSDSALRRYAAEVQQYPNVRHDGGRAGLFSFAWVSSREDGAVEFVTGYGFKNPYGFMYLPSGTSTHQQVEHVFGPWYKFGGG